MFNSQQLLQAGNFLSSLGTPSNSLQKHEIITVNGLQEAKDFRLDKGERIALIDANADILYIKDCDDIGKYNLKIYECKDITEQFQLQNTPANISKAEFDKLSNDIADLKTFLMNRGSNGKYNVDK